MDIKDINKTYRRDTTMEVRAASFDNAVTQVHTQLKALLPAFRYRVTLRSVEMEACSEYFTYIFDLYRM